MSKNASTIKPTCNFYIRCNVLALAESNLNQINNIILHDPIISTLQTRPTVYSRAIRRKYEPLPLTNLGSYLHRLTVPTNHLNGHPAIGHTLCSSTNSPNTSSVYSMKVKW